MINIKLRRCTSEANRLTKSFVSNTDKNYQGIFRESQDVLSPSFKIETTDDLSIYNYAEITEFGRKYFARPVALQYNLWELNCEVDVLSTYEQGIKNSDVLVKRTGKTGKINYYMNDGVFFTEQRELVIYNAFKKNSSYAKLGNECYYLVVAGG